MVNGAGSKSAEAFEVLIHKLSDQEYYWTNLKKLKDLGFEVSNLSSMLNSAGKKSAETFEALINKLTNPETLTNLKKLKDLGFEPSNLSSIVNGAGSKSAEAFEALIHKLSDENIRDNLKKLKDLGFEVSNLSSMVNGAGHKSPEAFEQLINKLTNKESFSKLETLQAQGIQCGHLSALVRGSGMKAFDALNDVINILTNDKYLDTIKKVSAAIYTTPDVINKNDEILVSSKASKLLKAIGDLRKQPSINDPSEHRQFKKFLTDCYAKGNHVEDSLLEVQRVSNDDPRKSLHGQDKVVAKKKITKGTILGIYTGILLCEEDPIDHAIEFAYLATKGIYGVNKLNSYSFGIDLDTSVPLYLSACGRGNILAKINANQTYDAQSNDHQANKPNVLALWNSYDGVTPFILFSATQDIPANTELLLDYGQLYWSDHNGNDDVSNPDANAYRSCLAQKKHYVGQSNSIMVLKLFNKHNPDLYQKLVEYIETPCFSALEGKDRMIECRKIDDANTIDYRIYKLPGEAAIGKPSQDYYSIDWHPSVGLDALNKYTYLFTPVDPPLISFDKQSGPISK
ncbi:SET domain-containing protein-lysine N-methyltransferase [Cardinium endosymbiont of Philonthus spinipes]|uniref:SET domain-containing protein-lysine N-methyltransferase n=1 Tax=Cardinium endosymbiont of Philonthus spinipes TaxID=3077941 RepID=UPI00313D2D06